MESNCTICLDRLKHPLGKPETCEHKFCFKCIDGWMKQRSECPLCNRTPKYLIRIENTDEETRVKVKKRTAKQFENELLVRDQLEENSGESSGEVDDITVTYACCRACKRSDNEHLLLLCDGIVGRNADGSAVRCNVAYHCYCLPEKLDQVPEGDWFCPFCAEQSENAHISTEQTNSKASSAHAEANSSRMSGKVFDPSQNLDSDEDGAKMETIEGSSITSSKSTAVACRGDLDEGSEYGDSESTTGSSGTNSDAGDNTDDDDNDEENYRGTTTESSNKWSNDDDSESENANGSDSDIVDDEDEDEDDDDDGEESEHFDSIYNIIAPMFPEPRGRARSKSANRVTRIAGRVVRIRAKTTSENCGYRRMNAAMTSHDFTVTRRHSA